MRQDNRQCTWGACRSAFRGWGGAGAITKVIIEGLGEPGVHDARQLRDATALHAYLVLRAAYTVPGQWLV